jgi:hypothetical protein
MFGKKYPYMLGKRYDERQRERHAQQILREIQLHELEILTAGI